MDGGGFQCSKPEARSRHSRILPRGLSFTRELCEKDSKVLHRSSKSKVSYANLELLPFYTELFLLGKGHLLFKFSPGTELTEAAFVGFLAATTSSSGSSTETQLLLRCQQMQQNKPKVREDRHNPSLRDRQTHVTNCYFLPFPLGLACREVRKTPLN